MPSTPRSPTSRRAFGPPSILVNNAGLGSSPADAALETGRFERYPESAWDAMLDSHLKSALVVSQSFIAQFRDARLDAGSIVNVSSTYGDRLAGSVGVRLSPPGWLGVLQADRLQRREVRAC